MTSRPPDRPPGGGLGRRGVDAPPEVPAVVGAIVEDRSSGFSGEIVRVEAGAIILRDWRGRERAFPLGHASFLVDDQPAVLVEPPDIARTEPAGPPQTASGSIAGARQPPQTASPHRIYVEGIHDAELLERVWGDELREAAIVVEPIGGADLLADAIDRFDPAPHRRLGVLLDHFVDGSKEHRIAERARTEHVLITGHPYVDVWQGIRPSAAGLDAWPVVPKGQDWKAGVCAALGASDPARLWRRLLRSVDSFADLEPGLVGAVERLLDFLVDAPNP